MLVVGATGMVGQAFLRAARDRGWTALGAARSGADLSLDARDPHSVGRAIDSAMPDILINAAAMIDLVACEADAESARAINTHAVGHLARAAAVSRARFIQVSTDQYWTGDGAMPHDEKAKATPVNVYGHTKLAAEYLVLEVGGLILRTNVTGSRGWPGKPTFAEWLCTAILDSAPLTLFDDYYTSTIDAVAFAEAALDLSELGASGLLNLAARDVCNKAEFATVMGRALGRKPNVVNRASVRTLVPRRAESAGLDCRRAEALLKRKLPFTEDVCRALAAQIAPRGSNFVV